ncbi:MAG TPA: hypothetical protein VEH27_11260 [Methylomirabilota bacterium]|nr:hypothetical protein [Methylomirabilota bacterium]
MRKIRPLFELVICALLVFVAWDNMRLREKLNAQHAASSPAADSLPLATEGTPTQELDDNEIQKREIMRLRAEVTRLKATPAMAYNGASKPPQGEMDRTPFPAGGLSNSRNVSENDDAAAINLTAAALSWKKLKIGENGSINLDAKPLALDEFTAECERMKTSNGAVVLFLETATGALTPAQIEVVQKLTQAQIPIQAVKTERELETFAAPPPH